MVLGTRLQGLRWCVPLGWLLAHRQQQQRELDEEEEPIHEPEGRVVARVEPEEKEHSGWASENRQPGTETIAVRLGSSGDVKQRQQDDQQRGKCRPHGILSRPESEEAQHLLGGKDGRDPQHPVSQDPEPYGAAKPLGMCVHTNLPCAAVSMPIGFIAFLNTPGGHVSPQASTWYPRDAPAGCSLARWCRNVSPPALPQLPRRRSPCAAGHRHRNHGRIAWSGALAVQGSPQDRVQSRYGGRAPGSTG